MHIGILSCGHTMPEVEGKHGDFPDMFRRLLDGQGFSFTDFDVEHMEFPSKINACDGWLLTGSKHGAYEEHAFIPPLETFIRQAFEHHVPMVGICFGHQIIAQALGGKVEKFGGGWALGLTEYAFDGLGPIKLNAWHQDQVTALPPGARAIGTNAFCENAALVYDDRIWTVQAHPEFSGEIIADYVALRKGTADYEDDRMDRAAALSREANDNTHLAAHIAGFFKQQREVARAS
ncbi:GMP synthase-like glutamine amidotransferase [Litoreibacter ponti]|uniref:GMP synthase-like glutamine amidotransferase n=1 Tax=Litoreibacter ponti TaxID=1510457 RepID=A0A2T6BK70_9RHOB|nr:type 1 glutamine amidotransferase [Litoreibacter ponti]PTX56446.1 GMP synthase-like glutamine amidotransferase [Litoreibacter ponti]